MAASGFLKRAKLPSVIARGGAAFAIAAGLAGAAQAHPHVWVTIETEILSDSEGRVTGLRHSWTFDEFFSTFATQGLDANGDGKLDRKELAALAEENVSSLKHFDYFTFAKAGEKEVELLDPPQDYFLVYEKQRLTLHFTLPLKQPANPREAKLSYEVYDPTFYVDFAYGEGEPVRLTANGQQGCRAELAAKPEPTATQTALSEAFYQGLGSNSDYGSQFARNVVVACDAK